MSKKSKYPILFQGNLNKRHYYEGWYYKQVSTDEKQVVSFIPGISLFDKDLHSFVQYIFVSKDQNNIRTIKTGYIKYPLEAFEFNDSPFKLNVGENSFSETMVSINLNDGEMSIKGNLKLQSFTTIEKSILMPNIMGFFAYIPKMECYHSVISMNHGLDGILKINDKEIDFSNGKGYIEKDWGTSFPSQYIWMQCNNFKNITTSIFASIANIPFMKRKFIGFICNLSVDGKEYRFATYKKSKMKIENITSKSVEIYLENRDSYLKIKGSMEQAGELIAPQNGKMQKLIKEGLSGEIKIYLYNKQDKNVYEDFGYMAGIEIVNFK